MTLSTSSRSRFVDYNRDYKLFCIKAGAHEAFSSTWATRVVKAKGDQLLPSFCGRASSGNAEVAKKYSLKDLEKKILHKNGISAPAGYGKMAMLINNLVPWLTARYCKTLLKSKHKRMRMCMQSDDCIYWPDCSSSKWWDNSLKGMLAARPGLAQTLVNAMKDHQKQRLIEALSL